MDWTKLSPEGALQAWIEYGRSGEDPYGLAFAMMIGDTRASDLVNAGEQARTGKAVTMRAADPIGYDVDTLISDYYLKPGLSEALRAYQRANNLTDQQMLDAIARSPDRSGATAAQNLNLLRGPDVSATAIKPPLSPSDVKSGVTTPIRPTTPTPVTVTPGTPAMPTPVTVTPGTPATPTPGAGLLLGVVAILFTLFG